MSQRQNLPVGLEISFDIETRADRPKPYRARARWVSSGERKSKSESFVDLDDAKAWIESLRRRATHGLDPAAATMTLADYGDAVMSLATRGLEAKTLDPYLAGWRLRVVPTLGHIPTANVRNGMVDRAVYGWIADECSRSTVKNSLAILVRVMEQAVRDGLIDSNPARVVGWQQEYKQAEDELDDPRSLALPDWATLAKLADALVAESLGRYEGWGDVVKFAACTAARIGEVSGVRKRDVDRDAWIWTVRRQTTTAPGGLVDKGTKGKRARHVPIIEEIRDLVSERLDASKDPMARLFTGPRGGRISTAVLRDATSWDDVVRRFGLEHLRRHDLRHTGLTWMADAGVPVHVLQRIAGHGSITTTQRYLHPDRRAIDAASRSLSDHLKGSMSPNGPQPGDEDQEDNDADE